MSERVMLSEQPLDSPQAWVGVWIRVRSGPTSRGSTVGVDRWHKIGAVGARLSTACGGGPRAGILWPSGGARFEVARPGWASLPGEVCGRCSASRYVEEVEVPGGEWLDRITEQVAERLARLSPPLVQEPDA